MPQRAHAQRRRAPLLCGGGACGRPWRPRLRQCARDERPRHLLARRRRVPRGGALSYGRPASLARALVGGGRPRALRGGACGHGTGGVPGGGWSVPADGGPSRLPLAPHGGPRLAPAGGGGGSLPPRSGATTGVEPGARRGSRGRCLPHKAARGPGPASARPLSSPGVGDGVARTPTLRRARWGAGPPADAGGGRVWRGPGRRGVCGDGGGRVAVVRGSRCGTGVRLLRLVLQLGICQAHADGRLPPLPWLPAGAGRSLRARRAAAADGARGRRRRPARHSLSRGPRLARVRRHAGAPAGRDVAGVVAGRHRRGVALRLRGLLGPLLRAHVSARGRCRRDGTTRVLTARPPDRRCDHGRAVSHRLLLSPRQHARLPRRPHPQRVRPVAGACDGGRVAGGCLALRRLAPLGDGRRSVGGPLRERAGGDGLDGGAALRCTGDGLDRRAVARCPAQFNGAAERRLRGPRGNPVRR